MLDESSENSQELAESSEKNDKKRGFSFCKATDINKDFAACWNYQASKYDETKSFYNLN